MIVLTEIEMTETGRTAKNMWMIKDDKSSKNAVAKSVQASCRNTNTEKATVLYTTFKTGYGIFFIASTEKGICRLHWPHSRNLMYRVQHHLNCRFVKDSGYFSDVVHQVKSYLDGKKQSFSCELDLSTGTPFQRKCWEALLTIPYGETRTYKWLAERVGKPTAYRAVGQANHSNPVPIIVPCHRVIGMDGKMVGYGGPSKSGQIMKRKLLEMEGALERCCKQ